MNGRYLYWRLVWNSPALWLMPGRYPSAGRTNCQQMSPGLLDRHAPMQQLYAPRLLNSVSSSCTESNTIISIIIHDSAYCPLLVPNIRVYESPEGILVRYESIFQLNACYNFVQKLLVSRLLSENVKIKIQQSIILLVVRYAYETWSVT
jgi:hypothetical protein